MKVRTGGSAGAWNNDRNFLTFLPKATLVITAWAPTRCTPRDAENGPLNSGAGPRHDADHRGGQGNHHHSRRTGQRQERNSRHPVSQRERRRKRWNRPVLRRRQPTRGRRAGNRRVGQHLPTFTEDGPHSITASYSGAPGFLASTSASAKIVTVTTDAPPDAVTTTATVSPSTAKVGQDVNLTAKVDPQGTGGTVDFIVDGTETVSAPVGTDGLPSLRTPSPRPERTRLSRSSRAHQDSPRPLPRHSRSV
ncbi:hypothetical protein ACETU7_34985 [Rhodococcus sp. 3Y1]